MFSSYVDGWYELIAEFAPTAAADAIKGNIAAASGARAA